MINNKPFLESLLKSLAVAFLILVLVTIILNKSGQLKPPIVVVPTTECSASMYNEKKPEIAGLLLLSY